VTEKEVLSLKTTNNASNEINSSSDADSNVVASDSSKSNSEFALDIGSYIGGNMNECY
jgi:hypothetical protein